jgi:uncharacterized membrane protein YsdA (DUF1294 family)
MDHMQSVVVGYLIAVAGLSVLSFVAYGWDKSRAVRGGRRVPENTLHMLALLGGWPGALLGQQQFRHKTKKVSFRVTFWLTVALHFSIIGAVIYSWDRLPADLAGPAGLVEPAGPIITPNRKPHPSPIDRTESNPSPAGPIITPNRTPRRSPADM